jgi:uncharacterized membrane protein
MPDVMKAGLAMYIFSFVFGLASPSVSGSRELSKEEAAALLGLGIIALPLISANIVGLITACLGRAWGAILMICTTAITMVLLSGCTDILPLGEPLYALSGILSLASLICFAVPSAWTYYRQCEEHRKSR